MHRSTSKNSLLDVMDPWFSGDSARPLTTSRPGYHVDSHVGDDEAEAEYRRASDPSEQLSNMYRGRNLELRDYAQYTGNYRFTVGDHVDDDEKEGGGRATWQNVQLGGSQQQHNSGHQLIYNEEESLDNGGSSIMGLADAEGNGFDYASFREDSSSHHARSIAEHGSLDGPGSHATTTTTTWYMGEQTEVSQGDEAAAVETEVFVGGEGGAGQQQQQQQQQFEVGVPAELTTSWKKGGPVLNEAPYQRNEVVAAPMVRTGNKARETLRGMTAAEDTMERALQLNIDKRLSSMISTGGAMDSLDRICTIEELWECASVGWLLFSFKAFRRENEKREEKSHSCRSRI